MYLARYDNPAGDEQTVVFHVPVIRGLYTRMVIDWTVEVVEKSSRENHGKKCPD